MKTAHRVQKNEAGGAGQARPILEAQEDAQGTLFEPPAFAAVLPPPHTLDDVALRMMCARTAPIDSPAFQHETGSWRLAACVRQLRKMGWPIVTKSASLGRTKRGHRTIAQYVLPSYAKAAVLTQGGQ